MSLTAASLLPLNARLADRVLLCTQLTALSLLVLPFALAPEWIKHPWLALVAAVVQVSSIFAARLPSVLRSRPTRQHCLELVGLTLAASIFVFSTGADNAFAYTLYLLPLIALAVAVPLWFAVLIGTVALGGVIALTQYAAGALPSPALLAMELLLLFGPGLAAAVVLVSLRTQLRRAQRDIEQLGSTDQLTGLLNTRAFSELLEQEHRRAERFARSYTLIMVDVDNVAEINDSLGYEAGNQILIAVAEAIRRSIRSSDTAARFGGDEFIVLLSESDANTGTTIAKRIRSLVYAGTISVANRLLRANVSLGVAQFPDDHLYPRELLALATKRMQEEQQLRRASVTS